MLRFTVPLIALFALPALAQQAPMEGIYTGSGEGELSLDLRPTEAGGYSAALSTNVAMSDAGMGCGGSVEGEVTFEGSVGTLRAPNEFYEAGSDNLMMSSEFCEVTLTPDGEFDLILEESPGCLAYHGASCGFSGTVTHDAAGI